MKKHLLIPDYLFETIFDITPAFLRAQGVRGVLVDIDGTAASHHDPLPDRALHKWTAALRESGIEVLFLSNNRVERAAAFAQAVDAPSIGRACKPFSKGFCCGLEKLGVLREQAAVIGDQIYTDTLGGNRLGLLTLMVRSIDRAEPLIKLRWLLERPFARRATRYKGEE